MTPLLGGRGAGAAGAASGALQVSERLEVFTLDAPVPAELLGREPAEMNLPPDNRLRDAENGCHIVSAHPLILRHIASVLNCSLQQKLSRVDVILEKRYYARVEERGEMGSNVVGECILWDGNIDPGTGYGRGGGHQSGTGFSAHRRAYEKAYGPIPPGFTVDHLCHNADPSCPGGKCPHRRCVNPRHLEAVSRGVNVLRGKTITAANQAKLACPLGHPYTGSYKRPNGKRVRVCRVCRNAQQLAYSARKAAR